MKESEKMETTTIVGKGNVGSHLYKALRNICADAVLVDSRTLERLDASSKIIIIAVSDSGIPEVARSIYLRIPDFKGVVAHTAGSVGMNVLKPYFGHYGVFYPLQTFSREVDIVNFREIPVFIEGADSHSSESLMKLAHTVSNSVYEYSSDLRRKLHLASVFACNFVNAMYSIAEDILEEDSIPFETVHALIWMTARKVLSRSPEECQTGPAHRGDLEVIASHLDALATSPEIAGIYRSVTDYILKKYGKD